MRQKGAVWLDELKSLGTQMKLPASITDFLLKRGWLLRQVKYRLDVPHHPIDRQISLLKRAGLVKPVIFDLGANLGDLTSRYRSAFESPTIYSFEPLSGLVKKLTTRFEGDDCITVVPLAVSDRNGTEAFHLTGFHTTNSLLPRRQSGRQYYPDFAASTDQQIEVQTTTLDSFCDENSIERVDLLKMDIQGGELQALKGATHLLTNISPGMIFLESAVVAHYEGESLLHEVTAFLSNFGYSLYDLFHLYPARNGQLRYCESLFVSEAFRTEVLDAFPPE